MRTHSPKGNFIPSSLKKAEGTKGSIAAIFSGIKIESLIVQLLKLPASKRGQVKEITLDMVNFLKTIVIKCFPKAIQVTDSFDVQKFTLGY